MASGNTVICHLDSSTLELLQRIDNGVEFLCRAQKRDHNPHYRNVVRERNGGKLLRVEETSDEDSSYSDINIQFGVEIEHPSNDESELQSAATPASPSSAITVQEVVTMPLSDSKPTGM